MQLIVPAHELKISLKIKPDYKYDLGYLNEPQKAFLNGVFGIIQTVPSFKEQSPDIHNKFH